MKINEGGTTAFPSFCDGKAFFYLFWRKESGRVVYRSAKEAAAFITPMHN